METKRILSLVLATLLTVTANMGEYFPDDLHPNDMGYSLMAQAFKTALEESLVK